MTDPAPTPAPPARSWLRRRRWWLAGAVLVLGAAAGAVGWRLATPPTRDPTLAQLDRAKADLAAGRFPEARENLRSVLDQWPLDPEAHFLLARACRRDDDLDGWHHHLRAASVLRWPTGDIQREQFLAQIQTGALRPAGGAAVESEDEWVLMQEALAKGYLTGYRIDDLLACTRDWIDRRPDDWQPYYLRGRGYQYARLLARAADDFRAALGRNPTYAPARLRLAQALMVDGLYQPAAVEYALFLEAHPRHPDALVGLANCRSNLAQPDAARAALERLFAVVPDHPAGCLLRAQLEADPAAALEWLRKAQRRAPKETDITSALVRVLNQLGRHDEAACYQYHLDELRAHHLQLDEVRRQVRRDPDNPRLRVEAGELCESLGRTAEAVDWFESALALDPNDRAARRALEHVYQRGQSRSTEK